MLLQEYHEEFERDLLDVGIDILDFWRGEVSLRRMGVVLRTFGPRTALHRVLVDQWGYEAHLLATVADILQMGNWQRGGDAKARKPQPIRRPGDARTAVAEAESIRERAMALRDRTRGVTNG